MKAGRVAPRLADIEAAAQQKVLAYDRAGDGHYDTASAFIKSLRGNDPDGALYWLATMIAAGEDPRFIVRRLIISASEDVGNADPRALQVAVAAAAALDHVACPGAVRPRPGDDLHRHGTEVQPLRRGLLGGRGQPGVRAAPGGSRCTSGTPATAGSSSTATAWATATGPNSMAPMSASSTCPTPSSSGATTCPTTRATRRRSRPGWRADRGPEAARQRGRPEREAIPGPKADAMKAGGSIMKTREENRRKLAETEKRDAGTD